MRKGTAGERSRQAFWIGLAILVTGTLSFFYWAGKKQVWFCDEIYTYESANGFEQPWPNTNVDQWMTGDDVEAYFAADWNVLSLNDISVRLYSDHVPLYFWLFRMISVLCFRGSGSIWIGLSMNLVFYLAVLALCYGVFLRLTRSPIASGTATILTGIVNRVMLEQATALRMYMMLLLAELLLLLGGVWILRGARRKKMSAGVFLYLFAVSVAGFLTHYDYWIFYAVTAAMFCLWLLFQAVKEKGKKFWSAWEFRYAAAWVGNFLLSLLATIYLFPYCRWNLNRGKGQTALYSLLNFSEDKGRQIVWGYQRLAASIFGDAFPAAAALLLLFGCIAGGGVILYRKREREKLAVLILAVLIAQAYQFAVCFTLPAAWEERYLWGVFTIMILCMAWGGILLLEELLRILKEKELAPVLTRCGISLLCIGILAWELAVIDGGNGVAYLFHPDKDVAVLKEHGNIPWLVYGPLGGVYSYYDWIIPEQICFVTEENTPEDADAVRAMPGDSFVLYAFEEYLPTALDFFRQELGRELHAEYLTKSTNLTVYLIQ